MATKDWKLSKDNPAVTVVNDDRYSNLNLNQSFFQASDDADDKFLKKRDSLPALTSSQSFSLKKVSWNKSNKHLSKSSIILEHDHGEKDELKKSKSANNSTLSLHIAAYENSVEADSSKTTKFHGFTMNPPINLFEFPRQQKENIGNVPEVMQFKTSQKLINPNEDSRNERAKRRAQKKEADDEKKKADDEKKEAAQKKEAEDGKKEVGLLKKGNSNAKPLKNEDVGKQSIEKIVLPKINLSPDSLLQAVEELNARKDINVFFIAQQVDYLTTINDTVKFNIYRDKNVSLLDNMNGIPLKVTLNYETSGTVGDFLVQVICKFSEKGNLHETISFMKDQTVNFEKFTLKQIGTDQFLAPDGILGNHKFIGEFISRGKDVELMIDEKIIREYVKPVVERNAIIDLQKDYKNEKVIYEINKILEKIDDGDLETKQLHDQLFGKVNELTKKCNFILNHEIQCALENMDFKYLKLSIESLLQLYYAATNLYYKNERLSVSPIRFSTDVDELFSIHLKSLNNFPKSVFEKFSSIRLQIELMYGTQPLGINQGEEKSKKEYLKESFIFKELFLNELKICMLPREARIGLSIFGIKKGKSAKMIGFVSLPVFDNDGSLLQGEVIAPFTIKNDTIPEPWGPHPVILSNEDSVVVLKMPEFPCQIRFPEIKEKALKSLDFNLLSSKLQETINNILDSSTLHTDLTTGEKEILWENKNYLTTNSEALLPVLAATPTWDASNLSTIYSLINEWKQPVPQHMLQILLPTFPDAIIRKFALNIISNGSSAFLNSIIPQLIEAIQFEPNDDSELSRFILKRSTEDRGFATTVYWQLFQRSSCENRYSKRFQHLLTLMEELKIPNFSNEVTRFNKILNYLSKLSQSLKESTSNEQEKCLNFFVQINRMIQSTNIRVPLFPSIICNSMDINNSKALSSNAKPILMILKGIEKRNFLFIFKQGDDLRRDAVVLQLVQFMQEIWFRENLDLRMVTYFVIPTAKNEGIIEVVTGCKSLNEIHQLVRPGIASISQSDAITHWIQKQNPGEAEYQIALDNFIRSSAGWCVATYVLGIGDRHNDNILVNECGKIFHIDFGKIMGDLQLFMNINRDKSPFVLTESMLRVINNGSKNESERFQLFVTYCCSAFNLLRKNASQLLFMIKSMSITSESPMSQDSYDFVLGRLHLNMEDDQKACDFFSQLINKSAKSIWTQINFSAHVCVQNLFNSKILYRKENEAFSFTTQTHNFQTDGKIKKVELTCFEKWSDPVKVYMYVFDVTRLNNLKSTVYRSFEEICQLYRLLVEKFPNSRIPSFETKNGFIFAQRKAAVKRRERIIKLFDSLFELKDKKVKESDFMYTFFHPIHRDTDPESLRNERNMKYHQPPQIQVTISTNDVNMKIEIQNAKYLSLRSDGSAPDTYVQINFGNKQYKTEVIKGTTSPTYNKFFNIKFNDQKQMKKASIELNVYQKQLKSNSDILLCSSTINCWTVFKSKPNQFNEYHLSLILLQSL